MNPKMTITIGECGKAFVATEGIVSYGAKVDVVVNGLSPTCVPDWGDDASYSGKSLRFRLVSQQGEDLVLFPLNKKTDTSLGDQWTVSSEAFYAYDVDFNTLALREKMKSVPYNEGYEAGVIIDSKVDAAEYGVGSFYVRQWSNDGSDIPSVLPEWADRLAVKPTTGNLATSASMDDIIAKVNTLIGQLKGSS